MKNFNLLLEQVQQLLMEANYKPLHKIIQMHILNGASYKGKTYSELDEQDKKKVQENIQMVVNQLEKLFDANKFPDNSKQWIINIFATEQQDFLSDREKLFDQMKRYLYLKQHDKLNKEQKNLNNLKYDDFLQVLKEFESEREAEENFGDNEIVRHDGDWKIIKFENYEDTLPYIDGSKSNWCIKYELNFNETYRPPYYAFYKNNKAYALFHENSAQLKDVDDKPFNEISEEFERQIFWLVKHLHIHKFKEVGDMSSLLLQYKDKYIHLFEYQDLLTHYRQNRQTKEYYNILEPEEHPTHQQHALFMACIHGNTEEAIKILKVVGVQKDKSNLYDGMNFWMFKYEDSEFKNTPWDMACKYDSDEIVKYCIDNCLDALQKDKYLCTWGLIFACENGALNVIKLLLELPFININASNKYTGYNPLISTIDNRQTETAKLLLTHPNIDVNYDTNDYTPLMRTVTTFVKPIFDLLIKHPNINVNCLSKGRKMTPLLYAIKHNIDMDDNRDMVRQLVAHPKIDINYTSASREAKEETALFIAVNEECEETMKIVLSHPKVDVNLPCTKDKIPPLIEAVKLNYIKGVKLLLKHPNIDVNAEDLSSATALMYAVLKENYSIVVELLKHPKIDVNIKSKQHNETALDLVSKARQLDIGKILRAHGAKTHEEL